MYLVLGFLAKRERESVPVMNIERVRVPLSFWLMWTAANIVGIASGWACGEIAGQATARIVGFRTGQIVACVIFEVLVWLTRGAVLRHVQQFSAWKTIDTVVWFSGEAVGWLMGEGFNQTPGPVWATAGAVWAISIGAALWVIMWFMRQPKPSSWWAIAAVAWALTGFMVGTAIIAIGIAITMEMQQAIGKMVNPFVGWAAAGATLGSFIGATTGLAFVRLLRWPTPEPP